MQVYDNLHFLGGGGGCGAGLCWERYQVVTWLPVCHDSFFFFLIFMALSSICLNHGLKMI